MIPTNMARALAGFFLREPLTCHGQGAWGFFLCELLTYHDQRPRVFLRKLLKCHGPQFVSFTVILFPHMAFFL